MAKETFVSEPPVHILSVVATIVIDYIWFVPELLQSFADNLGVAVVFVMLISALILGGICFLAVLLVQINVAHDTFGPAIAKAIVMSLIAAIPLPVSSTVVGVIILSWTGVHLTEAQVRKYLAK